MKDAAWDVHFMVSADQKCYMKGIPEKLMRDVLIDTIIKERMKERVPDHRKSA